MYSANDRREVLSDFILDWINQHRSITKTKLTSSSETVSDTFVITHPLKK